MSFSKQVKNEILDKPFENDCCQLAFLSGLINSCGVYDINPYKLRVGSDLEKLAPFIEKITKTLYGESIVISSIDNYGINKTTYHYIDFPENLAKKILFDTDCVKISEHGPQKNPLLNEYMIKSECDVKAFVAGVFIGTGTSSIKFSDENRKTTGYHLEFASKNYEFLSELASILAQYDIFARLIKRKNMYVLYVKDASEVSNVLALIGAYNAVLELQNEMATREVRNKVNRQTNCMSANINKTVEASIKQVNAIETIINEVGLETLPEDLQTVALLRLANTEESLEELLKLSKLPLTKSGLNHRFQKIIKIAEKINKNKEK